MSRWGTDSIEHARFSDCRVGFSPGDLLVVKTSRTLKAALSVKTAPKRSSSFISPRSCREGFGPPRSAYPGRPSRCRTATRARADASPCQRAGERTMLPRIRCWTFDSTSRLWMAALYFPVRAPLPSNVTGSPFDTATSAARGRSTMYQTVFAAEAGSADAVCRPAVHAGAVARLVSQASRSRRCCSTPASELRRA